MAKKVQNPMYRMQTWWSVTHNDQIHFQERDEKNWSIQFPTYRVECIDGKPVVTDRYRLAKTERFPKPRPKANSKDKILTF